MLANSRFALSAGALFIGVAAQGCSQPVDSSPHFVHGRVAVTSVAASAASTDGGTASAVKTAAVKTRDQNFEPGVPLVELNGFYEGCIDRTGPWSVAVTGNSITLDNPPLMVVQGDVNCQLIATEVRADQLYEAATPLQIDSWFPSPASSFTPLVPDGAPQVAFYASGANMDPGYGDDFTLMLFYSPGPNQTSAGTGATYATSSAGLEANQVPAPDYSVDLSEIAIQTDANQTVTSASGPVSFSINGTTGTGYVIDDGTLPTNPTFGDLDALYTGQSPTPVPWNNSFSIDASALSLQWNQLPLVRNVVIAGDWITGVRSYQVISVTFEPATDLTPMIRRIQTVRK
jgi:hypothetical protein